MSITPKYVKNSDIQGCKDLLQNFTNEFLDMKINPSAKFTEVSKDDIKYYSNRLKGIIHIINNDLKPKNIDQL